jgi:hypothetical protein
MTLILQLRIVGVLLVVLGLAHAHFCERFAWVEESRRLSAFNRQVLLVHAFFIALAVGLNGLLALFWAPALAAPSALGFPVNAGLALFWLVRLFFQLFIYEAALWRGKRLETAAHVAFTAFWAYLALLFAFCARLQMS